MGNFDWRTAQAYDEWEDLTKDYEKILKLRERVFTEINDWVKEETKKYESKIAPLMPYVQEKIEEMAEIQRQKYGEELREMGKE